MAKKPNQVDVKLSNATDNQTSINSKNGHNVGKGDDQNLSASDINVKGVPSNAQVSADVGEDYLNISLDSAWNSVKNVQVSSKDSADVKIDNFVHTDVRLDGNENSNVEVTGAKRGNIRTGGGDDNISVDAYTNGSGWSNQFNIFSGAGNDNITLSGDQGITFFHINAGDGNDTINLIGEYAGSYANLGEGNDVFNSGGGRDFVISNHGDNSISTGAGEDLIFTGKGNDVLDGGIGADRISSGDGDDIIKYDAEDDIIDAGKGDDTLVIDGDVDIDTQQVRRFENIEMTDGAGDDSVSITLEEARKLSDSDVVKIRGDVGDSVEAFDAKQQLDDVTENGINYAVFEGYKGEQIWVQHGLSVGDRVMGAPEPEQFEMKFVSEEAGYKNTVGYYVIDAEGNITDVNVNFDNASALNSGGDLINDYSTSAIDVADGSHVEFFMVANGYNLNKQFKNIDLEEGELKFVNGEGDAASIFDGSAPNLVYVDTNGEVTALKGDVYHTNNVGFSLDGKEHAVIEVSEDGSSVKISFEDLKGLGDKDFDDLVVEVNMGPFNGSVAGVEAGTGTSYDPVAVDDGLEQSTVLGSKESAGSMEDWGTVNEDGSVNFNKNGVTGTIQAVTRDGETGEVDYSVGGPGGGRYDFGLGVSDGASNEVDLNESLVLNFDGAVSGARVGLDSLYNNFNEGSKPDARVSYKAYKNGVLVAEGEVINDEGNVDGDGHRETNFFDVEGSFDSLVLETVSPTSTSNSNFVLRYVEVNTTVGFPVEEGEALELDVATLLANDYDLDGDVLNITAVSAESENGGSVEFNAETGEVTYIAAEGFTGADTFTYTITDNNGGESTATVHVHVEANTAPVAVDDGVQETVLLGTKEGNGELSDWGVVAEDGSVTFNKDGVVGKVEGFKNQDQLTDITFDHSDDGLGVKGNSDEVDFGETMVVSFETPNSGARIGLDSLYGNFDAGSKPDARVSYKAYKNGVLVVDGEIISDMNNVDGDGQRETNFFDIDVSFDQVVLEGYSPTSSSNSNFVLRYIEVHTAGEFTVEEGEPLTFDAATLLENDYDIDGDALNIISVSAESENGGVVELNSETGEVTYTSADGFTGDDTFTYTITDEHGYESTASVHVQVTEGTVVVDPEPENEAPVAADDVIVTDEDSAVSVSVDDLLLNDSDADGDTLTVTSVDAVSSNGGVVEFNEETGEVTYTPAANFNGDDTFTYTVSDGNGGESAATVQVTVNPVYDAPEAQAITATAVEDGAPVVLDASVLNTDGAELFYTLASTVDEGSVVNNNDGTFTFNVGNAFQDLDSGEVREVRFTYQITDLAGNSSVADAVITVAGVNDAPIARDSVFSFNEDEVVSVEGSFNVSDVDVEPLTVSLMSQLNAETEGTVTDNGDGTFSFTPATDPNAYNYLAADEQLVLEVAYEVTDGDETSTANLQFVINGVDDEVVAEEIVEETTDDGEDIIIDLGGAVNDPDGEVTISVPNPPNPETEGTLVDNGDGTFTFEPSPELDALDDGESQEITFEYEVVDEQGNTVTETVTIIVTGTNDAPVASNVIVNTTEDNYVIGQFDATDVDANDTLTYALVTAPDPETEGTVVVNGGQFTFYPAPSLNSMAEGETLDITFTYRANDGDATSDAVVTVTVVGTNDAPVVQSVEVNATEEQSAVQFDITAYMDDVDVDDTAESLTYSVNQPSKGQLVDLGNGLIEFRPNGEFDNLGAGDNYIMNVPVVVRDSHGASTTLYVNIVVAGENDAPVASEITVNTTEDALSTSFVIPASDVDADALAVTFVDVPEELNITVNGLNANVSTNSALQSLDDGESAVFNVVYTVSDGVETVQNVATFTVQGSNDAPIIESIQTTMLENDASVTHALTSVDFEGDDVVYLIQNPPLDSDGYVTIDNVNDTFTFHVGAGLDELQAGETKVVQFTYVATDGKDTSAPQTIQITIEGQNDAPVINSVSAVMGEDDGTQVFSLGVSDVDNALTELTYTMVSPPENGTVTLNGDGTFIFEPGESFQYLNDGESEIVEFTFSVNDGDNVVQRTAQVTVLGSTDALDVNSVFFSEPIHAVERFEQTFNLSDAFANVTGTETVTFTDLLGNPAPSFVRYDASTSKVVILTSNSDFGEYDIQVHVSNSTGSSVTQEFKLYVNEAGATLDANSQVAGAGEDRLEGTAGNEYLSSGSGNDQIFGNDGNDVIFGGAGNDYLVGGRGDDIFLLGGAYVEDGIDTFNGGDGYDSIVFHSGGSKVMYVDGVFDSTSSIEEVRSTQTGFGSIRGISNDDVIDLSEINLVGDFRLYGGSGNDSITGSVGDETIYGQAGNDTLNGYLGDDTLRGDAGNDILYGGEGNDYLDGGTGVDELYGGEGNDTLVWDSNDAMIDGGVGGFDTLDLSGQSTVDFTTEPANEVGFEMIDMSGSATEITLGLADVLEIKDTTVDTLYIQGNNGDNVNTDGMFEVTAQINVVDTNGDGVTDSTFQVYRSTLQSDVFIGIEVGVGMSLDGTIV